MNGPVLDRSLRAAISNGEVPSARSGHDERCPQDGEERRYLQNGSDVRPLRERMEHGRKDLLLVGEPTEAQHLGCGLNRCDHMSDGQDCRGGEEGSPGGCILEERRRGRSDCKDGSTGSQDGIQDQASA